MKQATLLASAWRHRTAVVALTVAGAVLGALMFVVLSPTPDYVADATLVVSEAAAGIGEVQGDRFVANQVEILRSAGVLARTAELVTEADAEVAFEVEDIAKRLTVGARSGTGVINLQFVADAPDVAVLAVNTAIEAYREVSRSELNTDAQNAISRIEAQVTQLDTRIAEINQEIAARTVAVEGLDALRQQIASAIDELAELNAEYDSATTTPERRAVIDERRDELDARIASFREAQNAQQGDPALGELETALEVALDRRTPLIQTLDQIEIDAELASDAIGYTSPATFAEESASLTLSRMAAGGLILGLLSGLALAYVLGTRRSTFAEHHEPEVILGRPLMSDIPDFSGEGLKTQVPVRDAPRSAAAEAYRFVATGIERGLRARKATVVSFTSSTIEHGKSTTTVNVAVAAARQGASVLVIDADFGSQASTKLLTGNDYNRSLGLTDVVAGGAELGEAVRSVPMGNDITLSLLSRGMHPSIASEILRSDAAVKLFGRLAKGYDMVFIDTPPVLQVAYASTILGYAETAVLVVRHDSPTSEFTDFVRRLDLTDTDIMGYVYNKAPLRRQMQETQGSMQDVLGDAGFVVESTPRAVGDGRTRRK